MQNDKFKIPFLFNPGLLSGKLPNSLFKKVRKAVLDPKSKQKSLNQDLVGSIKEEYETPHIPEFVDYLTEMYETWRDFYQTEVCDYEINPIWTNYMKKGEFNPNHLHPGGLAVFVLWVQIPYNLEDELSYNYSNPKYPSKNSCFEFTYARYDGVLQNTPIYVDKSYEGTIVMFPSSMIHCVYPFQTSYDYRISIAGNIIKT